MPSDLPPPNGDEPEPTPDDGAAAEGPPRGWSDEDQQAQATRGDHAPGTQANDPGAPLPPDPSNHLPGDAHGTFLDRRVVTYWLLTGVLGSLMFLVLVVAGVLVLRFRFPEYLPAGATFGGGLAALRLFWSLVAPRWAWLRWRYQVDPKLLRMRYGIIFHEERVIPVSRMQHVDMTRGPIERLFGLATLVVFTAGNEGSAFRVPGLAARTAEGLRDHILQARGEDVL